MTELCPTAALQAVSNGHRAVAEHLMEKTDRAVLEVADRQGRQAVHYAAGVAAEDGKVMYDWLVEYGADPKKTDMVSRTSINNGVRSNIGERQHGCQQLQNQRG